MLIRGRGLLCQCYVINTGCVIPLPLPVLVLSLAVIFRCWLVVAAHHSCIITCPMLSTPSPPPGYRLESSVAVIDETGFQSHVEFLHSGHQWETQDSVGGCQHTFTEVFLLTATLSVLLVSVSLHSPPGKRCPGNILCVFLQDK